MTTQAIAQALVQIPSVNPDGIPGTTHVGEEACALWIRDFLESAGATVELRDVLPSRPNVVGRFPSDHPNKPRILFAPHTDTVSVVGMTIPPFEGKIAEGRLWGRGASDTKGPMAAMLWALRECRTIIPSLPYEIWFAGLVGEEAGQFGAKALASQEHFDFVMAGEPTQLDVVHAHKGCAWITLRAHGRAVHASRPQDGDNAIYKISSAIEALRKEGLPALAELSDPILGSPTLSVGTIQGGSKVNIVPDFCEALVDVRTIPGQDIQPLLNIITRQVPDLEVEVRTSRPLFTPIQHPLIAALGACGAVPVGAPWFCDAAIFSSPDCAAVAIGPGSIAQAHTKDEFISLEDLTDGGQFFKNFLHSLVL